MAPDDHRGLSGRRTDRKSSAERRLSKRPLRPGSLRQLEARKLRSAHELEVAENSKSGAPGNRLKDRDLKLSNGFLFQNPYQLRSALR